MRVFLPFTRRPIAIKLLSCIYVRLTCSFVRPRFYTLAHLQACHAEARLNPKDLLHTSRVMEVASAQTFQPLPRWISCKEFRIQDRAWKEKDRDSRTGPERRRFNKENTSGQAVKILVGLVQHSCFPDKQPYCGLAHSCVSATYFKLQRQARIVSQTQASTLDRQQKLKDAAYKILLTLYSSRAGEHIDIMKSRNKTVLQLCLHMWDIFQSVFSNGLSTIPKQWNKQF